MNRNPSALHAETLEEVATSVTEEAWLYNENAINICFDYIHCSNLNSYIRFSKTYPSFLTVKEGSTFLTKPLFPQGREDVTALRCSEPLRYKVGGASKPSPYFAGWARMEKAVYYVITSQYLNTLTIAPHIIMIGS